MSVVKAKQIWRQNFSKLRRCCYFQFFESEDLTANFNYCSNLMSAIFKFTEVRNFILPDFVCKISFSNRYLSPRDIKISPIKNWMLMQNCLYSWKLFSSILCSFYILLTSQFHEIDVMEISMLMRIFFFKGKVEAKSFSKFCHLFFHAYVFMSSNSAEIKDIKRQRIRELADGS